MRFNDWTDEYYYITHWIKRRLKPESLEFYNDRKEDWLKADEYFDCFEDDLLKYINKKGTNISIRYKEFLLLCNRYLKLAKKENNNALGLIIFQVKNHLQVNFKSYKQKNYFDVNDYIRPCTRKEYLKAKKYYEIGDIKFNENFNVLTYRNINAFIDSVSDAYILNDKNQLKCFSLDWDWWFPIDEYLDLEKGWKDK